MSIIINIFAVKKDIIDFLNHFKSSNFEDNYCIRDSMGVQYSIKKHYLLEFDINLLEYLRLILNFTFRWLRWYTH